MQSRRARIHRDSFAGATKCGEIRLELRDAFAHHIVTAPKYLENRSLKFWGDRLVLRFEIKKRDHEASLKLISSTG